MPILNRIHNENKKVLYQDNSIRMIEDLRSIEEINKEQNQTGRKYRYKNNIIIEKYYGNDELGNQRWMEVGIPNACNEIIESYTDMIDAMISICKTKDDAANIFTKDDELKESTA